MFDQLIYDSLRIVLEILPFVIVILLGRLAWKMWVHYVRQDFISGIDFVLLEIIPPRDIVRSPRAMELFLTNALYQFSFKGGKEEYWQGAVWFWFSLELVSIEGQVHFYIRTPTRLRRLIETQIYAQYPQSQVRAVEDYTLSVDEITPTSTWQGWGCEWGLLKPEAYPIKTYLDFEMDKNTKEQQQVVDPISPVIELFGALGKGEQVWLQIVITPSKKEYHTSGTWFGHHDWVAQSRKELDKLLLPYTSHREVKEVNEVALGRSRVEIRVPDFLKRVMEAKSRKTSKLGFDTGIRLMYVAKKEAFSMNTRRDIRLIFRQYLTPDSNGLNRINSTQGDAFGAQFFGLSPLQVMKISNRMMQEYRERAFYHLPLRHHLFSMHGVFRVFPSIIIQPIVMFFVKKFFMPYFHHQTFVLNTEEIATLWHFPGQVLKTPTLERVESKEASPPPNLPT